jgi:integrase
MGYAQHVRSPKSGEYWLARYLKADGTYGTVKDEHTGKTVHYTGERKARQAANSAEAAVREGRAKDLAKEATPDVLTFHEWSSTWYAGLNLAASTMFNYRQHLALHILRFFKDHPVTDKGVLPPHIDMWMQQLRDDGHQESSIATYLGTLRACLAAAVRAGLLTSNPAAQGDDAGTGKRGVARAAAAAKREKVITTILGTILVGERIAILSGRDDDFILTAALMGGALRLGEGIGLEARYATPGNIRVEWQLSQVGKNLIRAIPKDGSRGDVAIPPFLSELLAWQAAHRAPVPCACHGLAYLFTGPGVRKPRGQGGVTVRDVAALAGVDPETAWSALADDGRLPQAVRARVRAAAKELGWLAGAAPLDADWHWRHSAFERLFAAAASGWWPAHGNREPERPVPLAGEWPGGTLLKYRGAQRRAEWGWLPVARGLTPHGLRHSMRTWMEENGIPYVFSELQLRHEQPDVYRHVTASMRAAHQERLQEAWEEALQRRGELHPSSPVRVVDALLREASQGVLARNSQGATVTALRGRR